LLGGAGGGEGDQPHQGDGRYAGVRFHENSPEWVGTRMLSIVAGSARRVANSTARVLRSSVSCSSGRTPDDRARDHRPRAVLRVVPTTLQVQLRAGPDGQALRPLLPRAAGRPAP